MFSAREGKSRMSDSMELDFQKVVSPHDGNWETIPGVAKETSMLLTGYPFLQPSINY